MEDVGGYFASGKTLVRAWMNARITHLTLLPPVLDLGAGGVGTASYHKIIPGFEELPVYSVDISRAKSPSVIADVERGIPFAGGFFHTCLAFNLLEHIYDHERTLSELHRVLRSGGALYLFVPFMVRVHADPYDYFRYTAYALRRKLDAVGFDDVVVEALGGGAMTAALAQIDFMLPTRIVRRLAVRCAFALDRLITRRSGGRYRNADDYPLGYFVTAYKP